MKLNSVPFHLKMHLSSIALMSNDRLYSIRDLSAEFGVSLRTLRVYEEKGLVKPLRQGRGGVRLDRWYSEADRARIQRILEAKVLGLTLAEIKTMLARPGAAQRLGDINLTRSEIEEQIAHLERQKHAVEEGLTALRSRLANISSALEVNEDILRTKQRTKLRGTKV